MTSGEWSDSDSVEYLLRYAEEDWLMLSVVFSEAGNIVGRTTPLPQVVDATVGLAGVLLDHGSPPGDLVEDDRDFVPWPGTRDEQLRRLKTELNAMAARDKFPVGSDICWFHRVAG